METVKHRNRFNATLPAKRRNRHTKRGHNFCAKCKGRINIGDPKTIKAGNILVCGRCEDVRKL